ncbi:unnamed protein product, partial [marine sediment metagenome]
MPITAISPQTVSAARAILLDNLDALGRAFEGYTPNIV